MSAAVEVTNVSKFYPLGGSLAGLRSLFASEGGAQKGPYVTALRAVTFVVQKGEAFGIVGSNGSGKSTLLQIVAGILRPTAGTVKVEGRLAALLELGSGFSPEFTGRENVYLNASLLGLKRAEIDEKFAAIERFAAIGDFMDQPVRAYSSGMVMRIAFAVVAHVDPEVLIVDEALAVGDIAFRQRCMRRIHELRARGTTILFVSHDTGDVKALCERCLWLDHGEARDIGEADAVVGRYLSATLNGWGDGDGLGDGSGESRPPQAVVAPPAPVEVGTSPAGTHRFGDRRAEITAAALRGEWKTGAHLTLRVAIRGRTAVERPIVGFLVRNERGETIFGTNTAREDYPIPAVAAGGARTVDFHFTAPDLAPGRYPVSVAVSDGTMEEFAVADYIEDAIGIEVAGSCAAGTGYINLPCTAIEIRRW